MCLEPQVVPKQYHRLVAVVVTHNRLDQLQKTLDHLFAERAADLAGVVVVDNASSDGTGAWLRTIADPRLDIVRLDKNVGGAGGFEQGMRRAMQYHTPDWIVLMDDDARPSPSAVRNFHEIDRNGSDAWAAAVYHPDGKICDMNRPSLNPFWHRSVLRRTLLGSGRNGFHLCASDYQAHETRDIDGTSFVGFFVSAVAIEKNGYPDGSLFLYGDDVLYTLTLRARGGRITFDPTLHFEHDFSTIGAEDKRFRPLWKSYYHYRNLFMIYRLCAGPWFAFVAPMAALKWLAKVRFHAGQRRTYLKLILLALLHGVRNRTDVALHDVQRWSGEG